ncbi:MAG: hypothetical protein K6T75_08095 [Acetobacteraceae bacterium]|nr:hypothetical protein [Acetobacteraceae bacterium]
MDCYIARLRLLGSFMTPWHADSLFGALCWTILHGEGEGRLQEFLAAYAAGAPPLVLSNAFPGDLLPRPEVVPRSPSLAAGEPVERARRAKVLKRVQYVTREAFRRAAAGLDFDADRQRLFQAEAVPHAVVSRASGTTAETGGLFVQTEWFPDCDRLTVYFKVRPEWLPTVEDAWEGLARTGFGKRKSTGKGAFELQAVEPCPHFGWEEEHDGFVALSNFVPSEADPVEGWYRLLVKRGRLGETFAGSPMPFKAPLLMIQAGSAFRVAREGRREYYGTMVRGVSPDPRVVHYGLAFPAPVRLPQAAEAAAPE